MPRRPAPPAHPAELPHRNPISRPGRLLLLLLALLAGPGIAEASCKTPVPTESLRSLDLSVDANPTLAIAKARELLARTRADDWLQIGELHAIIADALDWTGDDAAARDAVTAARRALGKLPETPDVAALLVRLALIETDTTEGNARLDANARAELAKWEHRLDPESLAHACVTIVRGRLSERAGDYASATRDVLSGYDRAVQLGDVDARSEAGIELTSIYQATGLYDEARAMSREVIATTRARNQLAPLDNALFELARTLRQSGHAADAIPVIREAREISSKLDDPINVAYNDLELCADEIAINDLNGAEAACRAAQAVFVQAGRHDQDLVAMGWRARIAMRRGDADEAIRLYSAALVDDARDLPQKIVGGFYQDYSKALSMRGRKADALAALEHYVALSATNDTRRQAAISAVVHAHSDYVTAERARLALDGKLIAERARAESRETILRLSTALAVGGGLLAVGFFYLWTLSRRQGRHLRQQELILRATVENSPDALLLLGPDGSVRFANRDLFGGPAPPAPGRRPEANAPSVAREVVASAVDRLLHNRRGFSLDIDVERDGTRRQIELRGLPIAEGDRLIGASLRGSDVTERRELERAVLDVAARERHQLSSDLHEGLGQELAGIALHLRAMSNATHKGLGIEPNACEELIEAVDRVVQGTRELAHGLSPVQTDRGLLSVALERLATISTKRLGIPVTFSSTPADIAITAETSDHCYRVAMEAITNAAKHAQCSIVRVTLLRSDEGLELTVADDGRGLSPETPGDQGIGLKMMVYRAHLVGGSVTIEPGLNGGTVVALRVPSQRL